MFPLSAWASCVAARLARDAITMRRDRSIVIVTRHRSRTDTIQYGGFGADKGYEDLVPPDPDKRHIEKKYGVHHGSTTLTEVRGLRGSQRLETESFQPSVARPGQR